MINFPINKQTARRYILGSQGLWPGRRWSGQAGTAQALHAIECVQMDPLNVVGRSHDLALWGRVVDYEPDQLSDLLYRQREFFDYGGNLRIYPMLELPYWRVTMQRKVREARWMNFARSYPALLRQVKNELRTHGPLGNRDFEGQSRVNSYRGRKDSSLALYYLWLAGELMIHHREGFERVYDLRRRIAPPELDRLANKKEAEGYFARKTLAYRGWCNVKNWASLMSFFTGRKFDLPEAQRWLDRMKSAGDVIQVMVEGEKNPGYLLAQDAGRLEAIQAGEIPQEWRPLSASNLEEVVFLAPLETVSSVGRAKELFDFDYIWEVYKPASKRRWGYYTLPILYGDRLVGRLDPRLNRETRTLEVKGFWLEEGISINQALENALSAGFQRFMRFIGAERIDSGDVLPDELSIPELHE